MKAQLEQICKSFTNENIWERRSEIEECLDQLDILVKSESLEEEEKERDMKKSILNSEMMGLNSPEHDIE